MLKLFILIVIALIALIIRMIILHKQEKNILINQHKEEIKKEREDAIKRSKDVTRGNISEEFIPLFPDFPYNMSECKFSGAPIDYIVFKGMTNVRDGTYVDMEIVFADVKVGNAKRTKVQNAIKKAIDEKRVRWETWRIGNDKKINIK